MEIERQTEVRLATWLCEAIEDTIKRYQLIAEMEEKEVTEDEAKAQGERKKQSDPLIGQYANPEMYVKFVESRKRLLATNKEGIDQLLVLLKSAREIRQQAINFWEGQKQRWQNEVRSKP